MLLLRKNNNVKKQINGKKRKFCERFYGEDQKNGHVVQKIKQDNFELVQK